MYHIVIGPVRYTASPVTGQPYTLVSAMRETYGCGGAHVYRADGTLVVGNAGSAYGFTHAPSGRCLVRGKARKRRWRAA